ncbi:PREDICTED: WD repeat-containing protein 3 isoform X2 [Crocodylus porosus]|uniref:WD repeat-containing protein 3 isoform X2 n=1 Tax=Crocodylus porosus TaxID=8502 RepID=UPI000938E6FF|nr:PREDICTED: WD repeat-containing protein 3 isoform X2 [Crocodylus porosus]
MGLTRQYLRYGVAAVFGLIASPKGNVAYVRLRGESGRYVAVPACEHVFLWDTRRGEKVLILQGLKQEVTSLCPSPDGLHLAVGYEDGAVRVFSLLNGEVIVTFNGHKASVTALKYDQLGGRLVSGSKDTDVIVWDIINESGLYRLKGHKDAVTQVLFLREKNLLVTSGKDTLVKWWDLDTQHCFRTLVGHRTEVWGLVLVSEEKRLITGAADSELRVWDITYLQEGKDPGEPESKKSKGSLAGAEETCSIDETLDLHEASEERLLRCSKVGSIMRDGRDRIVTLATDQTGRILACHGTDSILEVFYVLSEDEIHKKMERKMKKARKKARQQLQKEEEEPESSIELSLQEEIQRLVNIKASAKIKSTLQCIRTMECEYALCSLFVPGDRQVIIGTKTGKLQLFDLASGGLLETLAAHDGAVWSISLSPDQCGFITGGADKCVKFWEFELVKDENSAQKRLSVKHTRILQLDEDVLCVRYSPNQKLLAVSLLDCTVKIFHTDTLKFFLSLYGHKLPVLCMDITFDGALIATGSADRNVKIWGLDFGDCHRSLFAHNDSVMYLQFVPKSHLFFTAGKDHKIKQWDADKFQHIQTLEGHHQEVWCLAISPSGDHVVSSSHDKSLRIWERTREPLIVEEEQEMQREAEYEENVAKEEQPVVAGEVQGETGLAGKKTIETIKAAERIMEAIEMYREETAKLKEHEAICTAAGKEVPLPVNPVLQAYGNISPSSYVLEVFKKVKSSEVEESLLVLPFSYIPDLLTLFNEYIQVGTEVELFCRALLFLLRIHFGQITSNQMLVTVIENLKKTTISKVSEAQDMLGFNMAGLQYLKREIEAKGEVTFFADASDHFEEKKKKRKKKEKLILAVV